MTRGNSTFCVTRPTIPLTGHRPKLDYQPRIDGLRAIAVLSVILFHLDREWLPGGFLGVDVFFVISGFLITSIIQKDCQNKSFSLSGFYQRRVARILPPFFVATLATLAASAFIYSPQDLASAGANLAAAALSLTNIKLLFQGSYFQLSPDAQPYLHCWSLSLEEQFYLLFPLFFILTFKLHVQRQLQLLWSVFLASLAACLWLTHHQPAWAFYLLPTRAFELLSGSILAVYAAGVNQEKTAPAVLKDKTSIGLVILALSFVFISEKQPFPGLWPLIPIIGSIAILIPTGPKTGLVDKLMTSGPCVFVGRLSYSLYLWHWPVFSLVDYRMCLDSSTTRLALKLVLTLALAMLSYWLIEQPARRFFAESNRRQLAFNFAALVIIASVLIGYRIRETNYVETSIKQVVKGGRVFSPNHQTQSVVLMGDSNSAMYGKVLKELCLESHYKLTLLSVPAGDPLPMANDPTSSLWSNSLAVVRKEQPDCLILACSWSEKLRGRLERLPAALQALMPHVQRLILINQPPILPGNATRQALRDGVRPPFFEDTSIRTNRLAINQYLAGFVSTNVVLIDAATVLEGAKGEVLFFDADGRQVYQDATHLSAYGAELVRSKLKEALRPRF